MRSSVRGRRGPRSVDSGITDLIRNIKRCRDTLENRTSLSGEDLDGCLDGDGRVVGAIFVALVDAARQQLKRPSHLNICNTIMPPHAAMRQMVACLALRICLQVTACGTVHAGGWEKVGGSPETNSQPTYEYKPSAQLMYEVATGMPSLFPHASCCRMA